MSLERFCFLRSRIASVGNGVADVVECDLQQGVLGRFDDFLPVLRSESAHKSFQLREDVFDGI